MEKPRLTAYPMNYLLHVGVMLTIIKWKVFINLFLLVRIGNILAILLSMSSDILPYKMKSLFFSHKTKSFRKNNPISFNFCINFSGMKYNSSILFLAQALHTFVKRNLLKCNFLRLLSARVKICQIPRVYFELTNQFLFKSLDHSSLPWHKFPL